MMAAWLTRLRLFVGRGRPPTSLGGNVRFPAKPHISLASVFDPIRTLALCLLSTREHIFSRRSLPTRFEHWIAGTQS